MLMDESGRFYTDKRLQGYLLHSYKTRSPTTEIEDEGVSTINGKKIGYFTMISQALDQPIYNHIFLTDCEEKLLVGIFNCLEKDKAVWKTVAEQIVYSLKVK